MEIVKRQRLRQLYIQREIDGYIQKEIEGNEIVGDGKRERWRQLNRERER